MTRITGVDVSAYRIPTPRPESDGTLDWDATGILIVETVADDGLTGLGYSYTAARAAAVLVHDVLAEIVTGTDVDDLERTWIRMCRAVRNIGQGGLAATAISAVDVALWDLRARQRGEPLYRLLGAVRLATPVYGSGGFTSYSERELIDEACHWLDSGIRRVKIKVGTAHGTAVDEDTRRVHGLRNELGRDVDLFVDANGAYTAKQAVDVAGRFREDGVSYFEEPVPWHDILETAFVREHTTIAIAGGEYGFLSSDFRNLLVAGAVDVLQADATRCLGVTGFMRAAALADAFGVAFSSHTAPALHAHLCAAVPRIEHLEYFVDHVRIESAIFDGVPSVVDGELRPPTERPGLGLEFKRQDARRWAV